MSTCCPCTPASFNNMVPLASLLRHIMPVIPQLPHDMVLDRVRQSYTEFARRTGLVVAKLTQDYQAGVNDYALVPPTGYEVYSVVGIESPGYRFVDYWRGDNFGLWNTRFDVVDNKSIYIRSAPSVDQADGLTVYVVLLPTPCTDMIPESIATPYGKGITEGVLAELMLIPNKPYTSPGIARIHQLEFNKIILAGKHLAETNRKQGPLRAKRIRVV